MTTSAEQRWYPRPGGVTSLDAIQGCSGCGDIFYTEGTAWVNWNDPWSLVDFYYCDECAQMRGYELEWSPGWGFVCPRGVYFCPQT